MIPETGTCNPHQRRNGYLPDQDRKTGSKLPPRLAAVQLAEGILAPIVTWLTGESGCTSKALAFAIPKIAKATLRAMLPTAG